MTIKEINTVCYVGAGTMGCANSLVAAVAGYNAILYDISTETLEQVAATQTAMGEFLVGSGFCLAEDLAAAAQRITCTTDLAEAVANADLVSESVIEDLSIKRKVHAELDRVCPETTIQTTNTSSLLVSEIEDVVERGDRFAALHSHLGTPLIDIVGGPRTSPGTIDVLKRYVESLRSVPLVLKHENRGYVLNALIGPLVSAALMLVIEGASSKEDVDRAWMLHRKAPMGPFGMMDLFGLNVVYDSSQQREDDPATAEVKAKILAFLKEFLDRGELGVKTGKGFYDYPDPPFEQTGFLDETGNLAIPHYVMTAALLRNAVMLAVTDVAEPDEIDRAWIVGMNLDTGPFAILDEMGVDNFLELLASQPGFMNSEEIDMAEKYLRQREGELRVSA
jgi:3-hydroxybutyryl-CoA dehydrogenase